MSWLAWDHVCTPKRLSGASILNLYEHMVARRFTFIQFMFEGVQPWTKMVVYFIENNIIKLGNMKVEANWWNGIISERHVKCAMLVIVDRLLTSWLKYVVFCAMTSSTRMRMCQFITNGGLGDVEVTEVRR